MGQKRTRSQGSAIILVVAVLAALVLIGSVFLMTTVSQKKVALAHRQAVPMNEAVEGIMGQIGEQLAFGLHIGNSGPYSDPNFSGNWHAYIDYPSPDPHFGHFDDFLASIELARAGGQNGRYPTPNRWSKMTDLVGFQDANICRDQDPNWDYVSLNNGASWANVIDPNWTGVATDLARLVDTDGDGVRDAILVPAGVYNEAGQQFYAAVRIIDLSGLVNANTAYKCSLPTVPTVAAPWNSLMTQCMVDPNAFPNMTILRCPVFPGAALGGWRDPNVPSDANSPEAMSTPFSHFWRIACRLDNPDVLGAPNFRAFDWSDELACRLPLPTSLPDMGAGRLFYALDGNTGTQTFRDPALRDPTIGYGHALTTYSAGRIFMRPTPTIPWNGLPVKVDLNPPINTPPIGANRLAAWASYWNGFYRILQGFNLPAASPSFTARNIAAQLAVNLLDYRDGNDLYPTVVDPNWPQDLSHLPPGTVPVAGIKPQPFLVQAWCNRKFDPNDANMPPAHKDRVAVALYNPYAFPISMNGWKVSYTGININAEPNLSISVPMLGHAVLFTDPNMQTAIQGDGNQLDPNQAIAPFDLSAGTLTIYRPSKNISGVPNTADSTWVPVAQIGKNDFNNLQDTPIVDPNDPNNPNRFTELRFSYRDDRPGPTIHHYALAKYHQLPNVLDPNVDPNTYDFGNVPAAKIGHQWATGSETEFQKLPTTPIFLRGGDVANVADLSRLFIVGPQAAVTGSTGIPLDKGLVNLPAPFGLSGVQTHDMALGRLQSLDFSLLTNMAPYNLPPACLLGDVFTTQSSLEITLPPNANANWNDANRTLMLNGAFTGYIFRPGDAILITGGTNCIPGWYAIASQIDVNTVQLVASIAKDGSNHADVSAAKVRESVVHGRVNINTATLATLCTLPTLEATEAGRLRVAGSLLAYRDKLHSIQGGLDFATGANRGDVNGPLSSAVFPNSTALRVDTGFAAAGEVAIPLQLYSQSPPQLSPPVAAITTYPPNYQLGTAYGLSNLANDDGFIAANAPTSDLSKQNARYGYIGNTVAVNSDIFCAYIRIQLGNDKYPKSQRNYIAVFDRSNCFSVTDRPIVRMFTEIK